MEPTTASDTADPRHVARAIALQDLFTILIARRQLTIDKEVLLEELEVTDFDTDLYREIVTGVQSYVAAIDPVIEVLAPAWPIAQIAPVDLVLLRMGIWEGFIGKITPVKVVINEMIELAKQFGGSNSSKFVNGVLGSLLKNIELQEKLNLIQPDGHTTTDTTGTGATA